MVFDSKKVYLFKLLLFLPCLMVAVSAASFANGISKPIDHSLLQDFLTEVVNDQGDVNYLKAREKRPLLESYLSYFESPDFSISDFSTRWPREEKLATLINLFHAGVIRLILDYYPIRSIQDIPGGWDLTVINLAGKRMLSLNDLRESEILSVFRDEKIHTVLACGSKSCPPFNKEVFTGPTVEGQLYEIAVEFVNNPKFNEIDVSAKKVILSKIFKWYAKDFRLDFGFEENNKFSSSENSVLTFFAYYLQDSDKIEFLESRRYKIKYKPFDWSLREWGNQAQAT